jgi:cytidyltransferase-like protein
MTSILSEGGVAGHMNHLYDNPELTFAEMKNIFQAASSGELDGTEKTDGQNLQLSYDVKTGTARAARNKGNIKSGGLTAAGLAEKFGGRGPLEKAFTEAFAAFEQVVGQMSEEEQIEIFGPNTNIYYNAEVQDPRSANVINYDLPTLTIHRVGHNEYDRETGIPTGRDVSSNAFKLANALESQQTGREVGKFLVQMNAIRKLSALSDDKAVAVANARLEKVISDAGISDNQTVAEYMVSRVSDMVDKRIDLPLDVKKELMKRIFKEEGASLVKVRKLIPAGDTQMRKAVDELVKAAGNLKKAAISPVEEIVHDFSVEMLKGLESAFILDNKAEVGRLRAELQKAIEAIEASGSDEAMAILQKQMSKLKSIEGVSTAAEGFVFDYDGVTYKFTGNFAPMNQLLGLFKYGRGNVPALRKLDEEEQTGGQTVAVVPGAFKPPHRGHLEMVKHYANLADKVVIMVSPLPRRTPSGRDIDFSVSKAIWNLYLRDAGLSNKVEVIRSPVNSPVSATYQFVANEDNKPEMAQPGDIVIPGCSTKGGDEARFKANFEKYAREGVMIEDPISCAFVASSDDALSARDFRAALDAGAGLEDFIPDETSPEEVLSILGVEPGPEVPLDEMSSMAAGSVAGYSGSPVRKRTDEVVEEVLNYLISKGVLK